MRDDDLPLVALGAGGAFAAASLLGRTEARGASTGTPSVDEPGARVATPAPARTATWVFPVPDLGNRRPEISDGWASRRYDRDGSKVLHLGADIMFRRQRRGELVDAYPPGSRHGTAGYFMPDNVLALAAGEGVVTFAAWTARGFTVRIRHPEGWTTYYTHLSLLAVAPNQTVAAGLPIGVIGFDPSDRRRLMHLHFELWRGTSRSGATNPAPYLAAWERRSVASWTPPARNGGLA